MILFDTFKDDIKYFYIFILRDFLGYFVFPLKNHLNLPLRQTHLAGFKELPPSQHI